MMIAERTIAALGKIATGDAVSDDVRYGPYASGPDLVRFFNELGGNDVYGQGFPSRWQFAESKIREHNGSSTLPSVIEALFDPRRYIDSDIDLGKAVEYVNQYLKYDGYEVVESSGLYRVRNLTSGLVTTELPAASPETLSHRFIEEQLAKCDRKIADEDYDGAITNARTLLEGVMLAIEERLKGQPDPHDGDLPKLFKRVSKQLNLDPARQDISNSLRQVLVGLTSIVQGVSAMRNAMSDAHASNYRPSKHHARLATNSAKTVTDFLFETFEYQKARGTIIPQPQRK